MEVSVDNVWATPSTLHCRVTVWGPGRQWRHRYDAHVPVSTIPAEAIRALWQGEVEEAWHEDLSDIPLF